MPNRHGGHFLWRVGQRDGNNYQLLSTPAQEGKLSGLLRPNTRHTTVVQVRRNTIRCLLDLIRPDGGTVRVLGLDPQAEPVAVRARVGYLPGELRLDRGFSQQSNLPIRHPMSATRS